MDISATAAKLQKVVDNTVDNKNVFGSSVRLEKGDGAYVFSGASGNLAPETQYFIASTTKLYVTAIIQKLRASGKLSLDDTISKFLPTPVVNGLHVYKGVDYSAAITVRQLLAQTSGIPDYFQGKQASGKSLEDELMAGQDRYWSFEDSVALSKRMKPPFAPGAKGKALYSDTNFQLLGRIIEVSTGKTIAQAMADLLFAPLGLRKTYLYTESSDPRPAPLYYKARPLPIPQAMTSFAADGGIVSTAGESMLFLKAFFGGRLFPPDYLAEMKVWNRIFFPLQYGVGLTKFQLPRLFLPFQPQPELLGHSGLSGAFAYYAPEKEIYLTGTVNQISNPSLSYKLMLQLLGQV